MTRRWLTTAVCALALLVPGSHTAASAAENPESLRVMTRNLYLGADLAPVLAGPLDTTLPTVLLGDLNSAAGGVGAQPGTDTRSHRHLLDAGFTDAWTATHHRDPGFTCCQAPDLRNADSALSQRIDYVLLRGGVKALSTRRVGHRAADRTPSGLWPSDHAGLSGVLRLR